MKKIFSLAMLFALSTSTVFAYSNFGNSLRNAVKQDIKQQRQETREAVKKDLQNKYDESTYESRAKKAEKIKEIDKKLTSLNKELNEVNKSKDMTETEKVLRRRSLERQINFYKRQKDALK